MFHVFPFTLELSIFYQNIRGTKSKTDDIRNSVLGNNYDLICLSETWLNDDIHSSELFDDRYCVYRRDRCSRFKERFGKGYGGGVLVAVRKDIIVETRPGWHTSVEDIWLCLKFKKFFLNICLVYLPSYIPEDLFCTFIDNTESILLQTNITHSTLLLGDFNLPNISWSNNNSFSFDSSGGDSKYRHFCDFVTRNNLLQCNNLINHNGKILDLVLLNSLNGNIGGVSVDGAPPLSRPDAHHPPFEFTLHYTNNTTLKENISEMKYQFRKTNFDNCSSDLVMVDWSQYSDLSCEDYVRQMYEHIWSAIDSHTPKSKRGASTYPTWFSTGLKNALKEKEKFRARFKKFGNPRDYDTFSLLRNRAKSLLKTGFRKYISSIECGLSTNIKAFWRYAKSLRATNDIPKQMIYNDITEDDGLGIANLFAKYFSTVHADYQCSTYIPTFPTSNFIISKLVVDEDEVEKSLKNLDPNKGAGPDRIPPLFVRMCSTALAKPLTVAFNKSLSEGTFPLIWKTSQIVPIHKTGPKNDIQNYRPISVLCCFAKIFETLMYKHLNYHCKHMLSARQHGFVDKHSTTSNLLLYSQYLCNAFNEGVQVDSIYVDFSKAFDRVNHCILLQKLSHIGIHGSLLRWFESYLLNRSQLVTIYGFRSEPYTAVSGVPQGSNLGPLLFVVFINDLLDKLSCECLAYADDIKIFDMVHSLEDCKRLQTNMDTLDQWCSENLMLMNVKKCKVISFTRRKQVLNFPYSVLGVPLERVNNIRDLGVWFDTELSFRFHYNDIVTRTNKVVGFIQRIAKPFRNPESVLLLYKCLARSRLEYCSQIWSPFYKKHIDRLESIQIRFLGRLCGRLGLKTSLKDYNSRLSHFNLHSLQFRRKISDLTILHKIVNHNIEGNLIDLITFKVYYKSQRDPNIFYLPSCNNNVSHNSPLLRMCRYYNEYSGNLDVFSMSLTSFKNNLMLLNTI